jgi:hypothetical protein
LMKVELEASQLRRWFEFSLITGGSISPNLSGSDYFNR